jgi:hypothetical protein
MTKVKMPPSPQQHPGKLIPKNNSVQNRSVSEFKKKKKKKTLHEFLDPILKQEVKRNKKPNSPLSAQSSCLPSL